MGLGSDPYATWGWKKIGGTTLAVAFHVYDARTNDAGNWITYYAGPSAPPGAPNPIQVSPTVPTTWTTVTRNVLKVLESFSATTTTTPVEPRPTA